MIHKIDKINFENIKNGIKIYELYPFNAKSRKFNIKDVIYFSNNKEILCCNILEIKYYKTYREALIDKKIKNILPEENNLVKSINYYNSLYNLKNNYGIICIEIEML